MTTASCPACNSTAQRVARGSDRRLLTDQVALYLGEGDIGAELAAELITDAGALQETIGCN